MFLKVSLVAWIVLFYGIARSISTFMMSENKYCFVIFLFWKLWRKINTKSIKILVDQDPPQPNPKCFVCADKRECFVKLNPHAMTVRLLQDKVSWAFHFLGYFFCYLRGYIWMMNSHLNYFFLDLMFQEPNLFWLIICYAILKICIFFEACILVLDVFKTIKLRLTIFCRCYWKTIL